MKRTNNRKQGLRVVACAIAGSLLLTACAVNNNGYADFTIPEQGESTLEPVSSCYVQEAYGDRESLVEPTIETYTSRDGLCVIEVKEDYYDVTLNYEKGTHAEVGAAYAETILLAKPDYESIMEPYIYENLRNAFTGDIEDYNVVYERISTLESSLPQEYQDEIEAFATTMSQGVTGFKQDGIMSYEEAKLSQMVPDALRGTACSAISVWGDKSTTGARMTARLLEWNLGSDNQLCTVHCVVHMVNQEKSLTSISVLGLLDILTAVNDNGVMAGILDVGSDETYQCEGKTCYTFALRYALETYDNATDVGNYMVENSKNFTFCHNILVSDANHTYCAEDCVVDTAGTAVLRDSSTSLQNGLTWDDPNSFCIVNSFVTQGNEDNITGENQNLIRWIKYNEWIDAREQFTLNDLKDILTAEDPDADNCVTVYHEWTYQIILIDYATGEIHVMFPGVEGVQARADFVDVGNAYN